MAVKGARPAPTVLMAPLIAAQSGKDDKLVDLKDDGMAGWLQMIQNRRQTFIGVKKLVPDSTPA